MKIIDVLQIKGHHVTCVQESDIVASVLQVLAKERIGAVVVEDTRQHPVGIFSERDLLNAFARQGAEALRREVRDLMTRPIITCAASDRIDAVLARMTRSRIRHMPVVGEGKFAGIVSIGDLVHHRLDEKELEAATLLDLARLRH